MTDEPLRFVVDLSLDKPRQSFRFTTTTPIEEPCLCGTRFTCLADEHLPCGNCGGNPVTCDCDDS